MTRPAERSGAGVLIGYQGTVYDSDAPSGIWRCPEPGCDTVMGWVGGPADDDGCDPIQEHIAWHLAQAEDNSSTSTPDADARVVAAARTAVGHLRRVGHWDVCDLDALARAVDASPADDVPSWALARARDAVLDAARARAAAAAGTDPEAYRVADRALNDLVRALLLLESAAAEEDELCSCTPLVGGRHGRGCELYDGWAE